MILLQTTSEDNKVIQSLRKATELIKGRDPGIEGMQACTDARYFSSKNIPVAVFGPGSMSQAHVANEYVDTNQVVDAAKIYAATAFDLLR